MGTSRVHLEECLTPELRATSGASDSNGHYFARPGQGSTSPGPLARQVAACVGPGAGRGHDRKGLRKNKK